MSSILIESPNILVFDPSCGSGTLLKDAYSKITKLSKKKNFNTIIIGVEIYENAYNEAKILEQYNTNQLAINIIHNDIFAIFKELKDKYFQIDVNNASDKKPEQYIVLANPPFSKSQNLPFEYKKNICNVLKLENFKSVGLHCYFLSLIYQFLPNKGKFGLILPITISYTNQGVELVKDFFLKTRITKIIISEVETAFSIDSNFQEIIVIGYKNEFEENFSNQISIISLKKDVKIELAEYLAETIKGSVDSNSKEFLSSYFIYQNDLIDKIGLEGWNFLYRSEKLNTFMQNIAKSLIPIGIERNIRKKRGINVPTDFFFIPNKYYEIVDVTEKYVHLKLKSSFQDRFESHFQMIKLPKKFLKSLIRKPEFYKDRIKVSNKDLNENYCLIIHENQNDEGLSNYLTFGEKISVHKRSNTSNLTINWYLISNSYNAAGNLFLTFKWDPRYRSFLVNYSKEQNIIASQAFWIINVSYKHEGYEEFILAWLNSTLSMGLLYGLADVQRRVWRQLAGNRLNSILIIPPHYYSKLSKNEINIINIFINKTFNNSLYSELQQSIESITHGKMDANERVQIDLLFLNLIFSKTKEECLETLIIFYNELKEELARITNI